MRLIARRDASLAVALIAGTLVAVERPFRWLLDLVHEVEQRSHIDLLPALLLLTVVFVFHQYRKRLEARAEAGALAAAMIEARARAEELDRLMALGQSLADALDRHAFEQALWRALPAFIGDRECCVLWRHGGRVQFLRRDARMLARHSPESLEALVARVSASGAGGGAGEAAPAGRDLAVPLTVGEAVVGAIVVRDDPPLGERGRLALGAAAAVVAVAVRNLSVLQEARQSGTRDALTGCVTRAHALEALQNELRRARRTGHPLSIVLFDLDGFKNINDRGGHLDGDAVLASVGARLAQVLRSTDIRCRYGGDEFLAILPDTPLLGAQQVAECIRREIGDAPHGGERGLRVTASLGVACAHAGEFDPATLIARADEALYRAKRGGRNRWCVTAVPAPAVPPSDASTGGHHLRLAAG